MKKLILIILLLLINSCVSKSEHEKLLLENESLQMRLYLKEKELDSIKATKILSETYKNKIKNYSIEDAKIHLLTYYKFYARDMVFRNELVTKIDKNIFEISLEEGTKSLVKKSNSDVFWNAAVYRLTIISNSKYNMDKVR